MQIEPGLRGRTHLRVTEVDTAAALGSGDVPVLGTPRLLALAEAGTMAALGGVLDRDTTSVGTRVELQHLTATEVGGWVAVEALLVAVEGRLLHFDVEARDGSGTLVGRGRVTRALVDRARFVAGAGS